MMVHERSHRTAAVVDMDDDRTKCKFIPAGHRGFHPAKGRWVGGDDAVVTN
jgi:hypothetical protein